jgi:hypothetical protein
MVAGDSSEDEDGWRVHERYCIDHRAEYDTHEIVENVLTRAAVFMHDSGLRMDEDHVGKPGDLYLWCSIGGAKNWGIWGCPMRFTTGCPCAIRITETRNYLILQFHGDHGPECHSRPMMSGRNSRPAQRAFQTYLSAGGATGTEESGMKFLRHCIFFVAYLLLSLSRRWERPRSTPFSHGCDI